MDRPRRHRPELRGRLWLLAIATAALGCAPQGATTAGDGIDPLYEPFFRGKFDAFGHPFGAEVIDVPSACTEPGASGSDGWLLLSGPGASACTAAVSSGRGPTTVNVRARAESACADTSCEGTAFTIRVSSPQGVVAEEPVSASSFAEAGERNVPVSFVLPAAAELSVALLPGTGDVEVDYVELFPSIDNLSFDPGSSTGPTGELRLEYRGRRSDVELHVSCNGVDVTDTIDDMVAAGTATRERGDFRTLLTIPAGAFEDDCAAPRTLVATASVGAWNVAAARITRGFRLPGCDFEPGTTHVLLTGFEPFPVDAGGPNSSGEAVRSFDPQTVPGISVVRMILPVEFRTAPALVDELIDGCQPDVVVSFGQGRDRVDVETTAYNLMDTSEFPGGVPDNRGDVETGAAIEPDGPDELSTGLPVAAITGALDARGIAARESDDPGRYVCNDVFYSLMRTASERGIQAGFVHLPALGTIDDAARAELAETVTAVVGTTVASP